MRRCNEASHAALHERRAPRLRVAAALCATSLLSSHALAQTPEINFHRLTPPLHPEGSLATEPVDTLGPWTPMAAAWLSYGRDAIEVQTLNGETVATPLRRQLMLDTVLALGLGTAVSVGVHVPAALSQDGDSPAKWDAEGSAVPGRALGDVALRGKAVFVAPIDDAAGRHGFGLGVRAWLGVPTATKQAYLGNGSVSGQLEGLVEYAFGLVSLRAAAGALLRPARELLADTFGSALVGALSVSARPTTRGLWSGLLGTAEARMDVPVADGIDEPNAMLGLSARYSLLGFSVFAGPEFPLNAAPGSPVWRAIGGLGWTVPEPDSDADGIPDSVDRCLSDPEDRDGDTDTDGCPDLDADGDGVPDTTDQCTNKTGQPVSERHREDVDGFEDSDGCPDPDNDKDGVPDNADQCPEEPGDNVAGMQRPGCPLLDSDSDGLKDDFDQCPTKAEDRDQFEDDDGCPELDNDKDGVPDAEDACPGESGTQTYPQNRRGCPDQDPDGDTYEGEADRCPEEPEDFDGVEDGDGCAEEGPGDTNLPLLEIRTVGDKERVTFRIEPRVIIGEDGNAHIDAASLPSLRALAQLLKHRPDTTASIHHRPEGRAQSSDGGDAVARHVVHRIDELVGRVGTAMLGPAEAPPTGARNTTGRWVVTLERSAQR